MGKCNFREYKDSSQLTYPEIGDVKYRCALWTFKQQLAFKMVL